ncbi:hypothetical protein [Burkholderia cenocepacia]|uniref:hypothetical protein n=1 Tax=Burkholderia cenocepacia TaxID=95486 RepID=UPI001B921C5E|nr:hypothetical protein [Burkholderia cenocepacia]MBR7905822.1 hypothetical protein [Burkholderia cenocepacia]MBR8426612.1 hypothetical protein [Burkholderia cenocepacia]
MSDIYNDLIAYEPVRKQRVGARLVKPGDEFKPVAVLVEALKANGWRLHDVLDFFYTTRFSHVPDEQKIDNKQLINKLYVWRKQKVYTREDVEVELVLVRQKLGRNSDIDELKRGGLVTQNTIDIMKQEHNSIDFLKHCKEIFGELDDARKLSLLSFYRENKDKYFSIDGLISALQEQEKSITEGV